MKRKTLVAGMALLSLAASTSLLPATALAQGTFPTRSITMVVPFPPGGLADLVARPVAEAMSRELGQPVVIENKAGAGGGIGMAYAAKAKPDGYTVVMALSSLTVLPEADVVLGRAPMYALADLRPIARRTGAAWLAGVITRFCSWPCRPDCVCRRSPGFVAAPFVWAPGRTSGSSARAARSARRR